MMRFGFSSTCARTDGHLGAQKGRERRCTMVLENDRGRLAGDGGAGEAEGEEEDAHGEGETVLEILEAGIPRV